MACVLANAVQRQLNWCGRGKKGKIGFQNFRMKTVIYSKQLPGLYWTYLYSKYVYYLNLTETIIGGGHLEHFTASVVKLMQLRHAMLWAEMHQTSLKTRFIWSNSTMEDSIDKLTCTNSYECTSVGLCMILSGFCCLPL